MTNEEDNPATPLASKPSPSPIKSQSSSSHAPRNNSISASTKAVQKSANEFIISAASKIASQPIQVSDPRVWAVVTAISNRARKRPEGMNMLLTLDQHCIGRTVEGPSFQIMAPAVSATHCKIYKKQISPEDADNLPNNCICAFLKDSSTNGTYLNWEKLTKSSPEAKLQHGDIISIAFAPHHEHAFAFVYREVSRFASPADGTLLKRKADELGNGNKRLKGIGIGSSEGPISLDDFRSLQRSNTELRKQLESQVVIIDSLRSENRAINERHEAALKELNESVSKSYIDQMKELQQKLEGKEKELAESSRISSEQKHALEDLTVRLNACEQSLVEANEIICSQKASITELKTLLTEEREHRRDEREKALEDLKSNVQRVQAEAQEEIKRISDSASRREKELQEMIVKLQDSEKERSLLVESLRSKLEDARQKLVTSDNKNRQLEGLICEEQLTSKTRKKRIDDLEHEMKRSRKELESEKAAREEAWAKVSTLELQITAAMRDLDFESRRYKAARERLMLRETQLRAFYSTTEEIQGLFAKQQEQLKTMQKTLEDEDNYDNTSVDEFNLNQDNMSGLGDKGRRENINNKAEKVTSSTSAKRCGRDHSGTSDETSVTEKHDCNAKDHEKGQDTQEIEHTSAEHVKCGFGSEIYGAVAVPVTEGGLTETERCLETDAVGTAPILEGELVGTEQVLETESIGVTSDKNLDLNRCVSAGDTMQLDDENNTVENQEYALKTDTEDVRHSPNKGLEAEIIMDDTEEDTIKTSDLLASEVAGSWAYSTTPSVHGENDSSRVKDSEDVCPAVAHDSVGTVAESQNMPPSKVVSSTRNDERIALSEMIGIVAPDLKEQFSIPDRSDLQGGAEKMADSDSETDTDNCTDNEEGSNLNPLQVASDAETVGSDQENQESDSRNTVGEDNEGMEVDSPP